MATELPSRRRWPVTLVIALAVAGLAGVAVQLRDRMTGAVPPLARLYASIGLPVNADRLIISGLRGRIVENGSERYLAVEGQIANPYRMTLPVPKLQLAVRNHDGRMIYQWTADAGVAKLKPGESAPFRARLSAPPQSGRDVSARFAGLGG